MERSMSDQDPSHQLTKKLLPRLVAQRERPARQSAPYPADTVESDGPLEDGNDRNPGAGCAQALSPPLPAGFNPYFDLPPV
jgi:hypothetical protein